VLDFRIMGQQIRQRFVSFGTNFVAKDDDRSAEDLANNPGHLYANELAVDIGACCWGYANETRRVFDHHFERTDGNFPCASAAVLHHAEAIAAWAQATTGPVLWLVSHESPDFDALAAISLVEAIIRGGPPAFENDLSPLHPNGWLPAEGHRNRFDWFQPQVTLANQRDSWMFQVAGLAALTDQCKPLAVPLLQSLPGFLYAALFRGRPFETPDGKERRRFFHAVRDAVQAGGNALTDAILESSLEYAPERACLLNQAAAYKRDITRAGRVTLTMPTNKRFDEWYSIACDQPLLNDSGNVIAPHQSTGTRAVAGLYLRNPECFLFKNFARFDAENAHPNPGFEFLAIAYPADVTDHEKNTTESWFTLNPESAGEAHLYPVWERLQAAEVRARQEAGDTPDPKQRRGFEKRAQGAEKYFHQPWFDGGTAYRATLIRNPPGGTRIGPPGLRDDLSDDPVVALVREVLESGHLIGDEQSEVIGSIQWFASALRAETQINHETFAHTVGESLWLKLHPRQTIPTDFRSRHLLFDEDVVACWSRAGLAIAYANSATGVAKRDAVRLALQDLAGLAKRIPEMLAELKKVDESTPKHDQRDLLDHLRSTVFEVADLKWRLNSPQVRVVRRYFEALDIETELKALHELHDAHSSRTNLGQLVELQEHAGLVELVILGVYGAEVAHLFTAGAHETHFELTLVFLIGAPLFLCAISYWARHKERWRFAAPLAGLALLLALGAGLATMSHHAHEILTKKRIENETKTEQGRTQRQLEFEQRLSGELKAIRDQMPVNKRAKGSSQEKSTKQTTKQ
jgi:hypothetical protein